MEANSNATSTNTSSTTAPADTSTQSSTETSENLGSLRGNKSKGTSTKTEAPKADVSKESIKESGADKKDTTSSEPEKKYKVKIDGVEKEVTADELIRDYQLANASRQKMAEAAQLRKQSEEFINLLRTNPLKILKDPNLGVDVKKLAEEYLYEIYSEEQMTPEQKETRAKLKRLEELETEKKQMEEQMQAERQKVLVEKYQQEYQKEISEALNESGLPNTKGVLNRIIYYMHQSLQESAQSGVEPLKAKDVIKLVRQDLIDETKDLYGNLDGEVLAQMMGDGVMKKIRQYDLGKVKTKSKVPLGQTNSVVSNKDQDVPTKKSLSKEDWKMRLAKIKAGEE